MSALERFEAALESRDCRRGGRGMWTCPTHEDSSPSLSVKTGEDGRVLVHCFAGCAAADVLAAVGCTMTDLFEDSGNGQGSVVATYGYVDKAGVLLFEVLRFAPKDFRQRRPDGSGGWVWKLGDVGRVLYRLPHVLAAVAAGRRVFVVEGEKDVHALEGLGEVATCNAGGAGKWRPDYAEALSGAEVVVVADADEAGRAHAATVARSLRGVAASVRIVEAAQGKDVSEHLEAGLGVEELRPVDLDRAQPTRPPDKGATAGAGGDGFVRLSDVTEREIDWYWPGRIARASVVLLVGDGGAGKLTLVQELGARMTRGEAPPGGEPGSTRGVVILSAEEDAEAIIRPRMRLMGADLARVTVLDPDELAIRLPEDADRLEARCRAEDAGLVVVDVGPAFLGRGLKSNSDEDIRRFFAPLRALAERLRCVVIVLVHLNKNTAAGAQHRIMGGAAWRNVARQVLVVGPPPGQDPRETGERLVAVEKNNYTPAPFAPAYAFRLAPDGEEPSWAVVVWGSALAGVRPDDLVRSAPNDEERSESEAARDFLGTELADGRREVTKLKQAASGASIAWRTVERAKRDLGVEARKGGYREGWWWQLPDLPPKAAKGDGGLADAGLGGLRENLDEEGDLGEAVSGRPPRLQSGGLPGNGAAGSPPHAPFLLLGDDPPDHPRYGREPS